MILNSVRVGSVLSTVLRGMWRSTDPLQIQHLEVPVVK